MLVLLAIWVGGGDPPPDEGHWAFRAPRRPAPPAVRDSRWVRNDLDRFVLARLEREGLRPSPEADRATLARRLWLDLVGMPPTVAELDAFLADRRPDAYERAVDRLLASVHYGEHRARLWLDLARYADTNGFEKDRPRSIWPYRDWVIDAFARDMPLDVFTVKQIAGDLLENATLADRIATGFHRNTMLNEEGGIDVEEYRWRAVVDRVDTTATVWLGLTIGCARCHDHKYDPFSQEEYWRLFAFFDQADEPEIEVPDPEIEARRAELLQRIAAAEAKLAERYPGDLAADAARWAAKVAASARRWTILEPARAVSQKGATMEVLADRSVLVSGDWPQTDTYVVEADLPAGAVSGLRLEALPHESLPRGGPGRAPIYKPGDFLLSELRAEVDGRALTFASATHDHAHPDRPAAAALDGVLETGWSVEGAVGRPHRAVFALREPLRVPAGARLRLVLRQHGIHQMTLGRFRLAVTADPAPVACALPDQLERILLREPAARTGAERRALVRAFLAVTPALKKARAEIEALRRRLPRSPTTLVMRERRPEHARVTRFHARGEFTRPRHVVRPGVPAVLHPLPPAAPPNRLTLARWLVAPDNPLFARVFANRIWRSFFGRGLVETVEDFGTRGDRPSHPELLDWLACELRRGGYSVKHLVRLIVTSATYRQSSAAAPAAWRRDPHDVLLARGPRLRVDAETLRDLALRAADLLDLRVGGPSVFPPQPEGVTSLSYGALAWRTSQGPDRYRRGLYTFKKRTTPYAAFVTFDGPSGETTCPRRPRSNTPLQALTLLDDEVFVEAAQALARRALDEVEGGDAERVRFLMRALTGRAPEPAETKAMRRFLARQRARLRAGELDAKALCGCERPDAIEAAAFTALARALLNLDETVTKG